MSYAVPNGLQASRSANKQHVDAIINLASSSFLDEDCLAEDKENGGSSSSTLTAGSELTQAFQEFAALSNQLSHTYRDLEVRVGQLTEELAEESDQRIRALEEKESLANRLEHLLNFLPGGVVVLDARGIVTERNPVAIEMLGEPLMGAAWRDVIERCFCPKEDDGHEVSTHDGHRISIATRSLGSQGQIILLTDQTETRKLQAQLSRHERLSSLGKMVSALAHQIRTPLSAALLYAGHLGNEKITPVQRSDFSQKIIKRLVHMEQQVRDMLLFVKGDLVLNDRLTLREISDALSEQIEPLLENVSLTCSWRVSQHDVLVHCNKDVLISALMNLVNNAIQAVNGNVKLEIDISSNNNEVRIAILDNGPGVMGHDVQDLQEAFVTTKSQGIGLGLAVVNTVAKGHGGRFELSNREDANSGAQATILLPRVAPRLQSL
ncbi:sensor histidine kinase [Aurantivibrio infirmus]